MKKFAAKINITLRNSILDVQGKTVEQALHAMDFPMLNDLRIGKYITMSVEAENKDKALAIVDEACKKMIANPIIEDYVINIEEINK